MNINLSKLLRLAALSAGVVTTQAQQVISPIPPVPATPPAMQEYVTETTGAPAPQVAPGVPQGNTPLQWGPVSLRPRMNYQFLYGNGFPTSLSNHVSSAVHEIAPGLILGIGTHWTVDYAPTWTYYSNPQLHDTFDQAITLTGGTIYEDWVLGISQSYVTSSGPLLQTGTQTAQESYSTALTASYTISSALRLDMALNQNFRFVEKFSSSREWSTMDWLVYQAWTHFDAAIGTGFGYVNLDQSPDETYEQLQGRIAWKPSKKFRMNVHGGAEFRQTPQTLINPIYGAGLQYQPFEVTTFSLDASRSVETSYFQGQLTETTRVNLDLTQRLFERYFATVGGGYGTADYITAKTGDSAGRNDTFYSFSARLSTSFWKHGTLSAFYQYTDNTSSQSIFSFRSQQVGCQIGFRY